LRGALCRRAAAPAAASLECAAANVGAAARALSPPELARVVRQLNRARVVYVMGFGQCAHLAGALAAHLQPFCAHVLDVAAQGGSEVAAGQLAHIGGRDVLFAIALPRYSLDALRLAHYARERGACVIALTDSPASPLAGLGDLVLYAEGSHPVLPSSACAALALIEALAVALMASDKNNVAKAACLGEAVATYLYGATPASGGARALPKRGAASGKTP
ncbi:MurR/RpiR family transcriptional regulator, partial [Janthinobacterium sp.]|uniref:MurR/RpiR family transcriptional regulator n=1 Tax=Janthinobacterium sp. TaxID=1871054 RepID=UPI00293D81C6